MYDAFSDAMGMRSTRSSALSDRISDSFSTNRWASSQEPKSAQCVKNTNKVISCGLGFHISFNWQVGSPDNGVTEHSFSSFVAEAVHDLLCLLHNRRASINR